MKKADTRVVGWRPDFFLSGDGGTSPHPTPPHTSPWRAPPPSHTPTTRTPTPISPHIDEDALEGVYFAFLTILRCLSYFFRKTRPRASYELLEALSSSLAADRASVGRGAACPSPIPHSNTLHNPISPHIDEDALEGLYFAFSTILRCLPYFLRKTRPRASYELLEAFSSSLTQDGAIRWSRDGIPRAHLGAWNPESRSIYHTRAGNPNSGWWSGTRRFAHIRQRPSQSSLPHPAPAHLHPAPPIPPPPPTHPRAHTHAPTPEHPHPRAHTRAPTPNEKKFKKKVDTFFFCAYSACIAR